MPPQKEEGAEHSAAPEERALVTETSSANITGTSDKSATPATAEASGEVVILPRFQ